MRTTINRGQCGVNWLGACVLLISLLMSSTAQSAPLPIEIGQDFHDLALAGQVLANPRQSAFGSADEALAAFRSGAFELLPGNLGRGYKDGEAWLAFDLHNTDLADSALDVLILEVGPPFLDTVSVFQTAADGSLQSRGRAGDQVPREETRVLARQPTFVLNLRGNPRSTVLVHITTTSTVAGILRLYRPLAFHEIVGTHGLVLGGILMFNVIMVLFALGLYLLMRQPIYLAWFLFVGNTAATWVFIDGLAYRYLPLQDTSIINTATGLLTISGFAAWTFFIAIAFDIKSLSIRLHQAFVGWAIVVAGCLPLLTFFSFPAIVSVLMVSGGPILLISLLVVFLQIVRGNREAMWHGPLFLVYLAAAAYNASSNLGWTAYSNESLYGWQVAAMLNLLSLQISIINRVRQSQQAYATERARVVSLLSGEKQRLEAKVRERTQDLARALREVEKAEAGQRQLLAVASHEFRTPAAMIKASLDSLALFKDTIQPEVSRRMSNIGKACVRLNDLANNLISHERMQELSTNPKKSEADLRDLVLGVAQNYPADAGLQVVVPDQGVTFSFDPVLVTIALHNLVDNALRHNDPQNGLVCMGLLEADGKVELRVADHGAGIADADKEVVFERFFSSRGGHNTGLGLSIVDAVARSHGGRAYAQDHAPKGTVMVIELPVA